MSAACTGSVWLYFQASTVQHARVASGQAGQQVSDSCLTCLYTVQMHFARCSSPGQTAALRNQYQTPGLHCLLSTTTNRSCSVHSHNAGMARATQAAPPEAAASALRFQVCCGRRRLKSHRTTAESRPPERSSQGLQAIHRGRSNITNVRSKSVEAVLCILDFFTTPKHLALRPKSSVGSVDVEVL
jgi:hypothetical protein